MDSEKDNVISFKEAGNKIKLIKFKKSAEYDRMMAEVESDITHYQNQAGQGLATRGRWCIWVFNKEIKPGGPLMVVANMPGTDDMVLMMRGNLEKIDELIFETDVEAKAAIAKLEKKYGLLVKKGYEFRLMCGGLDKNQSNEH